MWHSVESRTPFSDDVNLISFVFSVPGSLKIQNGNLKHLLRQSAQKYLPKEILDRKDKMGYVTPHNNWLRELFKHIEKESFSDLKKYINTEKLEKNLKKLYSPDGDKERFFAFKVLAFLRWKRLFNI
jgi:asparagine synthase (glutamine-hydrolysing)